MGAGGGMAVRDAFVPSVQRTPPPRFARPCEVANLAYFATSRLFPAAVLVLSPAAAGARFVASDLRRLAPRGKLDMHLRLRRGLWFGRGRNRSVTRNAALIRRGEELRQVREE